MFVVDDDLLRQSGIKAIIDSNLQNDIKWVGKAMKNSPDLPKKVAAMKPHVVLIDAVLKPGCRFGDVKYEAESNGVAASRMIKEKFGNSVKIVLCSQYPEVQKAFRESGADEFVILNLQHEEFKQMIRDVAIGRKVHQPKFGDIVALSFSVKERRLTLFNDSDAHVNMRIKGAKVALLHYLIQERKLGEREWIHARDLGGFKLGRPDELKQIKALYERNPETSDSLSEISSQDLTVWAARINGEVALLAIGIIGPLIQGPGRGRPIYEGMDRTYSLNSSIKSVKIVE